MKNKIIAILIIAVAVQALLLLKTAKKEHNRTGSLLSRAKPEIIKPKGAGRKGASVKIAIILDDWGYNLNNLNTLKKIKPPLTLAILPNLTYSRRIAEEAHALGKEIILHLPLEPYKSNTAPLEKNTIMCGMNKNEIIGILQKDFISLSYAAGVSNHQGSKLTTDEGAVTVIFRQLKKQNLFFIDSLTSKSVCGKIANKLGVRFASRDVFLDNKSDEKYIEKQLRVLIKKAKSRGAAVGVGHDRTATLKVLQRLMPELEQNENIKFVFVSELTK